MTEYERSAIIGYYRQGASYVEIQFITGIPAYHIERIIETYLKLKDDEEKSENVDRSA